MPAVTLTSIRKDADGTVRVRVGKIERVYASLAHMQQCVRASLTRDDLIDLALALAMTRQPALANPAAFDGRTLTIDFTQANWGTVT